MHVSPAAGRDAISGMPFLIENALASLLSPALSGIGSESKIPLEVLLKKLVDESVKNWLGSLEYQK